MVLRAIGHAPYSNNREIAEAAGVSDEGQTSKLLTRLERQGVIENVGSGRPRGEPNAWLLTPAGRRALDSDRRELLSPHGAGAQGSGALVRRLAAYTSFSAQRRAWCATAPSRGQADEARGRPDGVRSLVSACDCRRSVATSYPREGWRAGRSSPRGKGAVEK